MPLPRKIPKPRKRASRWRSQAHCNWLRTFECVACSSAKSIEVSHVRIGTDGGMGRKPSDFYALPMCATCHAELHRVGERSFYAAKVPDYEQLMAEFGIFSPRSAEIRRAKAEKGNG